MYLNCKSIDKTSVLPYKITSSKFKFQKKMSAIKYSSSDYLDLAVYDAAKNGSLSEVQKLVKSGGSVQMAVMGAADGHKADVGAWSLLNGGCMRWTFKEDSF